MRNLKENVIAPAARRLGFLVAGYLAAYLPSETLDSVQTLVTLGTLAAWDLAISYAARQRRGRS